MKKSTVQIDYSKLLHTLEVMWSYVYLNLIDAMDKYQLDPSSQDLIDMINIAQILKDIDEMLELIRNIPARAELFLNNIKENDNV